MSFTFNYKKLEKLGYEISDDGNAIRVYAGDGAEHILQHETCQQVYADIQSTTRITGVEAENLMQGFLSALQNAHVWNIAVKDEVEL